MKEALLSLDGLGAPLRESKPPHRHVYRYLTVYAVAKRKGNDLFLTVPAIDRAFGADRALLNDVRTRYPSVHIQLHPSNDNRSGQVVLKGGTREVCILKSTLDKRGSAVAGTGRSVPRAVCVERGRHERKLPPRPPRSI